MSHHFIGTILQEPDEERSRMLKVISVVRSAAFAIVATMLTGEATRD